MLAVVPKPLFMKVGLVRHYKVKKAFPKKLLVSYSELKNWFDEYELAAIENNQSDLEAVEWNVCYSSPTKRAIETTMVLFNSKPRITSELKELNVLSLMNKKFKLPFIIWGILIRKKALSNNEITSNFKKKISSFVDLLLSKNENNVLIVSHGFVMMYLQKELKNRGFSGSYFKTPINGRIYKYEQKKVQTANN